MFTISAVNHQIEHIGWKCNMEIGKTQISENFVDMRKVKVILFNFKSWEKCQLKLTFKNLGLTHKG